MTASSTDPGYQKLLHDFGERIRHLRTARHWTPEQLAENSGLALKTILKIEAGETDCTMDTVVYFANAFNLKIAEIFQGIA